jgi:hypothetical protein
MVTIPGGYWTSTALSSEREAAGSIADTISQSLQSGVSWNAAVAKAAAAPFAMWAPGPAAVSHNGGTAVGLSPNRSRITLYASQRLYTFDVWRAGPSGSVKHSELQALTTPTSAQLQLAADTVAAQIVHLTQQQDPHNGFVQAVIEAYAGQSAMGMTTAPQAVYANSLQIVDGNTVHITVVEAGHHFGVTIKQRPDGTVVGGAVRPVG